MCFNFQRRQRKHFLSAKILSLDHTRPRPLCLWTKLQSSTSKVSRENIFSTPDRLKPLQNRRKLFLHPRSPYTTFWKPIFLELGTFPVHTRPSSNNVCSLLLPKRRDLLARMNKNHQQSPPLRFYEDAMTLHLSRQAKTVNFNFSVLGPFLP